MNEATFRVDVTKEQFVFSAAHFITFAGDICESLHGHNYRVKCEVRGPLDENHYVVDFIALRDRLLEIVKRLDHRVLLPTRHSMITVAEQESEVEVRFQNRRWLFPTDNCMLMPIANTTAELIAAYIADELMAIEDPRLGESIEALMVAVDENEGQWGCFETTWPWKRT